MDDTTMDDFGGDMGDDVPETPTRRRLSLDTRDFRRKLSDADRMAKAFSTTLSKAFSDLALKGKSFDSVLGSIARRLSQMALKAAFKPFETAMSSLFSTVFSGFGAGTGGAGAGGGLAGWLSSLFGGGGSVTPFAKGGVVAAPTYFPMSGGAGLMGEQGAEAIMPLARGPDGSLGVRTNGGGGSVSVTMHISTPDAEGFRRSRTEIAAELARAVERGRRGA